MTLTSSDLSRAVVARDGETYDAVAARRWLETVAKPIDPETVLARSRAPVRSEKIFWLRARPRSELRADSQRDRGARSKTCADATPSSAEGLEAEAPSEMPHTLEPNWHADFALRQLAAENTAPEARQARLRALHATDIISLDAITDPVVLSDGRVYDRAPLEAWARRHDAKKKGPLRSVFLNTPLRDTTAYRSKLHREALGLEPMGENAETAFDLGPAREPAQAPRDPALQAPFQISPPSRGGTPRRSRIPPPDRDWHRPSGGATFDSASLAITCAAATGGSAYGVYAAIHAGAGPLAILPMAGAMIGLAGTFFGLGRCSRGSPSLGW